MSRRYLCLLLITALLAGAIGCGGNSTTTPETTVPPVTTKKKPKKEKKEKPKADISEAQIKRYPSGSPEQVVLEWWRYIQLNDPAQARDLYLDPPALADLAGQFNYVEGKLDGQVEVISSEEGAEETEVRARWSPPKGEEQTVTLHLGSEGGTWKLLDTRFVDEIVAKMQRAEADG